MIKLSSNLPIGIDLYDKNENLNDLNLLLETNDKGYILPIKYYFLSSNKVTRHNARSIT